MAPWSAPGGVSEDHPAFSISKRLRVEASDGRSRFPHALERLDDRCLSELLVGLSRETIRALGVEVGQLLLVYTNESPAVPHRDERHAAPPGYAFGYTVELPPDELPAAHVGLPSMLRLQLGCETGAATRASLETAGPFALEVTFSP